MVRKGETQNSLNKIGRLKQIVGVLNDCSRYHFEFSFDLLQLMQVIVIVGDKYVFVVAISKLLAPNFLLIFVVFRAGKGWEIFFEFVADRHLLCRIFITILFILFWD